MPRLLRSLPGGSSKPSRGLLPSPSAPAAQGGHVCPVLREIVWAEGLSREARPLSAPCALAQDLSGWHQREARRTQHSQHPNRQDGSACPSQEPLMVCFPAPARQAGRGFQPCSSPHLAVPGEPSHPPGWPRWPQRVAGAPPRPWPSAVTQTAPKQCPARRNPALAMWPQLPDCPTPPLPSWVGASC